MTSLFTNSALLWFLPLALIPVLLHLLTLHRLKTVELSTFRFLFDSYVQQRRRMKFLEWLIALLRTLFLLFLVFAISRMRTPDHWQSLFGGGAGSRDVVLMFDTSASMGAATDGQTALERSQKAARRVLEQLKPGDHVTMIRVGERPEQLLRRFQASTEEIQNEIDNLDTSPSRGNLYAAFSQLFSGDSAELSKLSEPVIYLFTDLQQSGWEEFRGGESAVKVPPRTELRLVNVGSGRALDNFAVVGSAPAPARVIVGLPVTLRPRVRNYSLSKKSSSGFAVTTSINGQQVDRQTMAIDAGKTDELEVVYVPTEPGMLKGQFEIPGDPFLDDNLFRFTLDVRPQVGVLLVNGNPNPIPLEDSALYIKTALTATDALEDPAAVEADAADGTADPADPGEAVLTSGREFVRSLDVREIPQAELNADALEKAVVVILADCGQLDAARFILLRNFVNTGGGLIVLPGEKVNPEVYSKQFFPNPNDTKAPMLAASLAAAVGDPTKTETFSKFANVDFSSEILSVFTGGKTPYLTRVQVYRHFPLTLPEERGSSWPLISFAGSDAPALIEGSYGDGHIVLSAFPFHSKWTNLPMRPEFVPLVLRMVSHVMKQPELSGPSVVGAGGTAEFFAEEAGWDPVSAKVTGPGGQVSPLEQFQRSRARLVGAFERTVHQGFYDVEVSGGSTQRPKEGRLAFAVNLAAGESDFNTLGGNLQRTDDPVEAAKRMERVAATTVAMLEGLEPGTTLQVIDATAEAQQQFGEPGTQNEIWRWLIFVMFLVIAAEFLLSTLSGQVAGEEDDTALERIKQLSPGGWVGRMTGADVTEEAPTGAASK
jgi:hypothetical protein